MNYLEQGINCIAVNENKRAIFPWKQYQTRMITPDEFDLQMSDGLAKGVAVICGGVSGNLEVIDIDLKYATDDLWSQIAIPSELKEKLHIVKTRNNGLHIYYRCEVIEGNQKLAQRYATSEELKSQPQNKTYCLIETRGEGGYVVAPPSTGYEVIGGSGVNVITLDEREELLGIMRSFNQVYEEVIVEAHQRSREYGSSPFDDYNKRGDLDGLLVSHGWSVVRKNSVRTFYKRPGSESETSGSYNHEMGLFSVFSTNTPFTVGKGYRPYAVFCILECNGDFKVGAKKLVDLGYGERMVIVDGGLRAKKSQGLSNDELITHMVKKEHKTLEEAQRAIEIMESEPQLLTFWDVDFKKMKVTINLYKLQIFLSEEGGFRLFFYDNATTVYRLVRIREGFVEETSSEQVKKFIKDYIDRLPLGTFDGGINAQDILELVYKQSAQLFSENFFEFFPRADIEFLRDTKDVGYVPFKNGVVCVSADGIVIKSYNELNKCIWKNNVIDHDVLVDQGVEADKVEYFRFIKRIAGDDPERYMYALSLIGYLLHQYKDPARPFAVILGEETDNEEKGGGTGKGIFVKALSYIVKTIRVDGKNFNMSKNFAFQRVDVDTRIVAIEDTRRKVDFEGFYSIITEGITVEKKNKDEFFIPYKDSPKIMFTTNYTITQTGVHAKRRQRVFEFAPYFSNIHTPEDEFGHKLFDDWDKDEWNRFFNLLFYCLQDYLKNGVANMEFSEKMAKKAVKNNYGGEFLEWFEEFLGQPEVCGQWTSVESLHNEFLNVYGLDKKEYPRKRFSAAIKHGCELMKIDLESKRNVVEHNKIAIKISQKNESYF
jgi:hypothetical protein